MTRNVLVIGGGPGGSTAATLPARADLLVTLLERDTFPIDRTELFGPDVRSWQVDRDDFDRVLLDHANERWLMPRRFAEAETVPPAQPAAGHEQQALRSGACGEKK